MPSKLRSEAARLDGVTSQSAIVMACESKSGRSSSTNPNRTSTNYDVEISSKGARRYRK